MLDHSKFTKIEPIPLDRVKPERCIPFTIPIHIKGACLTMKALKNWRNRDYLKDVFRNAPVELEVYKKPEDVEISKCYMENSNFNSYLLLESGGTLPFCTLFICLSLFVK